MNKKLFLLAIFLSIICNPIFSASAIILDWNLPVIGSLSVKKVFNSGPVHLKITGKRFNYGVTVKLTKEGVPEIIARDLVITKNKISCTFDLLDQPIGNWNLVVTNHSIYSEKEHSTTLYNAVVVDFAAPEINSFFPQVIDFKNASLIQTKIRGAYFRDGIKVKLIGPDGISIEGIKLKLLADTQINCEFDLKGQPIGAFTLIVTNVDGKTAFLKNCFSIKKTDPEQLMIKKLKPAQKKTTLPEIKPVDPETPSPIVPTPVPTVNQPFKPAPPVTTPNEVPTAGVTNIASNPKSSLRSLSEINQKLRPIFFDANKFTIRDSELPSLENNLMLIKNNPGFLIAICGYGDQRGNKVNNLKLTQKRTETIRQFLVANDITEKITIFLLGSEISKHANHDQNQWQQNPKVEISLWEKQPTREQIAALKAY